jgi:uncharacterized membrane protein
MTRRGALGRLNRRPGLDDRPTPGSLDLLDGEEGAGGPVGGSGRDSGVGGPVGGSRPRVPSTRSKVDLGAPRRRGLHFGVRYDTEVFGRFSETIARFIGTGRFLVYQSIFIATWIVWNVVFKGASPSRDAHPLSFDPYPFQFLTLILSLQAAYAAPLILLAQNRQEMRDRRQNERDRQVASRTQADAEFITRELASIRLALSDVATVDEVDKALERALDRAAAARHDSPPKPTEKLGDKHH